jgi:hypothetical protein
MGDHTESYRLIVTDHVPGREGVARSLTGWESDPEAAIAAWHELAGNAADGTTVDLVRIEATSVMHQITAARPETVKRFKDPSPAGQQETAPLRTGPVWAEGLEPVPVSPYADHGDVSRVELTRPMAKAIRLARDGGGRISPEDARRHVPVGTIVALIDRGLMGSVEQGVPADTLTERGRRLADRMFGEMDLQQWIASGQGARKFDVPQD